MKRLDQARQIGLSKEEGGDLRLQVPPDPTGRESWEYSSIVGSRKGIPPRSGVIHGAVGGHSGQETADIGHSEGLNQAGSQEPRKRGKFETEPGNARAPSSPSSVWSPFTVSRPLVGLAALAFTLNHNP